MSKLIKENGYWRITYYDPASGRNKRISTKLKATKENKVLANQKKKELDAELEAHKDPSKFNSLKGFAAFSKALDEFYSSRDLADNTKALIGYATKYFKHACGDKAICLYRPAEINDKLDILFDKRKLSNNSQAIYRDHLHSIFEYFFEKKYIKENPIKTIPKKNKIVATIPDEHKKIILDELKKHTDYPNQYHSIFFLFSTGARISDAVALERKHINFDENLIIITNKKKGRQYEFPLTNALKEMFLSYSRKPEEKEFGYKDRSSFKFFYRACSNLKDSNNQPLPIYGFHKIRKTFNTKLWKLGVSVEDRTKLLNQTSMSTNQKNYTSYDNFERLKSILESEDGKVPDVKSGSIRGLNEAELSQFRVLMEKLLNSGA